MSDGEPLVRVTRCGRSGIRGCHAPTDCERFAKEFSAGRTKGKEVAIRSPIWVPAVRVVIFSGTARRTLDSRRQYIRILGMTGSSTRALIDCQSVVYIRRYSSSEFSFMVPYRESMRSFPLKSTYLTSLWCEGRISREALTEYSIRDVVIVKGLLERGLFARVYTPWGALRQGANILKIDLRSGYHQLRVKERTFPKAAFRTVMVFMNSWLCFWSHESSSVLKENNEEHSHVYEFSIGKLYAKFLVEFWMRLMERGRRFYGEEREIALKSLSSIGFLANSLSSTGSEVGTIVHQVEEEIFRDLERMISSYVFVEEWFWDSLRAEPEFRINDDGFLAGFDEDVSRIKNILVEWYEGRCGYVCVKVGERILEGPEMIEVTNEKVAVAHGESLRQAQTVKRSYADRLAER
ncbi:hypothetical protein Tco_0939854 [Tanacetum coccineum]|uniref:Reverse transcriptase n=1 Tax=Tanacetum coccineum TaxID=301880 RepID=A0ABQ5DSE2_9ASTR